jgi:hypothetical protein
VEFGLWDRDVRILGRLGRFRNRLFQSPPGALLPWNNGTLTALLLQLPLLLPIRKITTACNTPVQSALEGLVPENRTSGPTGPDVPLTKMFVVGRYRFVIAQP